MWSRCTLQSAHTCNLNNTSLYRGVLRRDGQTNELAASKLPNYCQRCLNKLFSSCQHWVLNESNPAYLELLPRIDIGSDAVWETIRLYNLAESRPISVKRLVVLHLVARPILVQQAPRLHLAK